MQNYNLRENGFKPYVEIEKMYKNNWHCNYLHSHTRQHCFKVYNKQEVKKAKATNVMAIDLGLDNLATLTFKEGNKTYLFCGKNLKVQLLL